MEFTSFGPLGDRHNFGKQVKLKETPRGPRVFKPRAVFWEKLFLDSDSAFRKNLKALGDSHCESYLGHINYSDVKPDHGGDCEFLSSSDIIMENSFLSETFFKNYGRLMAFATIFGITDLHVENLLKIGDYLQIMDIECIWYLAASPADTVLLPNRIAGKNSSIFDAIYNNQKNAIQIRIQWILLGLIQEFNFYTKNTNVIIDNLRNFQGEIDRTPIRFLLRPSKHYSKEFDKSQLDFPFLPEEERQLARGDVPYFFGYCSDQEKTLFEVTENGPSPLQSDFPAPISLKLARSFNSINSQLAPSRIAQIKKQSMIITAARFLANEKNFELKTEDLELTKIDNLIRLETNDLLLETTLIRSSR